LGAPLTQPFVLKQVPRLLAGNFLRRRTSNPAGRWVMLRDPAGNLIELVQWTA